MSGQKPKLICIFCGLNEDAGEEYRLTNEHIIPRVLGGWQKVPFVCKTCNNLWLGHKIESKLKRNGYIVTALDKLGIQPKKLVYREADIHLEFPSIGKLKAGFNSNGRPEIFTQKIEDGSIITPEEESDELLKKQIQRYENNTGSKISLDFLDNAELPFDVPIPISGTDIVFIRRKNQKPTLHISGLTEPIPFRVPAKIAFEHLSALDYAFVLKEEFDPLCRWILSEDDNKHVILNHPLRQVDPNDLKYLPYHYLKFEHDHGTLSAIVCLFGVLMFSVFLCKIENIKGFRNIDLLQYYHIYDLENRNIVSSIPPEYVVKNDKMYLSGAAKWGLYQMQNVSSKKSS